MKLLLIGGNGFIGKNIVEILKDKIEIHILDKYIDFDFFQGLGLPKEYLHEEDLISSKNDINECFASVDVIVYLVNFLNPYLGLEETKIAYSNDISMCINILNKSVENSINKVIFLSSGGTVYGNATDNFFSENTITNPISHYGISKLTLEKIFLMYNHLYNMNNIILRVSNPYGKYQISDKTGLISIYLRKIIEGNNLEVFGDGTAIRDYIYVGDLVEGILNGIKIKNNSSNVFNIGSGIGKSINEIISIIKNDLNLNFDVIYTENRNFDVNKNVLDISRAKNELNFSPKIELSEGIKHLYEYLLNNK